MIHDAHGHQIHREPRQTPRRNTQHRRTRTLLSASLSAKFPRRSHLAPFPISASPLPDLGFLPPAALECFRPERTHMSYVDGFVLPVPKKSIAAYRRIATKAGKIYGGFDVMVDV